jgi:formylglycine-generating enzyme required for sulfatase activity
MSTVALLTSLFVLLFWAPRDVVVVPGGAFSMGSEEEADERPIRRVHLPTFYIDRTEVTREEYAECVAAAACPPRSGLESSGARARLPVTEVSWDDAATYCRFVGARLPTEAEWEKAARGTDGRVYPWGDELDCSRGNFGNFEGEGRCPTNPGRPSPVGSFVAGASPYGALDLAGNVWEWVADTYADLSRKASSGPRPNLRVVRGGACCSMFGLPRAANRVAFPSDYRDVDLGFRCARSTLR